MRHARFLQKNLQLIQQPSGIHTHTHTYRGTRSLLWPSNVITSIVDQHINTGKNTGKKQTWKMSCAWFLHPPPTPSPARSKSPGWLAIDAAAWHAKQGFDGKLRLHNVLIGLNFEIIDATLHLSIANVKATQGLKAQCSLWHMKWLSSRLRIAQDIVPPFASGSFTSSNKTYIRWFGKSLWSDHDHWWRIF